MTEAERFMAKIENVRDDDAERGYSNTVSSTTDSFQLLPLEASRYPALTGAEEAELAKRIERGDMAAKERMIVSNLGLVISIAKRYESPGISLSDLVQEGVIGLIRAAEKFDWRRGHTFSSHARWRIRQAVRRAIANKSRPIRIPGHLFELAEKIARVEQRLVAELGRQPTDQEVAIHAKLPLAHVTELRDADWTVLSTDASLGVDGLAARRATLTRADSSVEDDADTRLLNDAVRRAVARLDASERLVITLHFGLDESEPVPLDTIAERLGIRRDRVEQIEAKALSHLATDATLRSVD